MFKVRMIQSVLVVIGLWIQGVYAIDTFQFSTPEKKQQALNLARSLRCPQCQNQNLVDSNSPIAKDLRLVVYKQVEQGATDEEVTHYMTQRYGDFILYQPRITMKTGLLWSAPLLLLFAAALFVFFLFYARSHKKKVMPLSLSEKDALDQMMQKVNKNKS